MVLAEVEAQASVDTHERRHVDTETVPGGTAPGNTPPRKIWRAPELTVSCEKCSYCGLWLRRDSVHRHLTSSCLARILSGALCPEQGDTKRKELWQPCVCVVLRRKHIDEGTRRSLQLKNQIVLWSEASQTLARFRAEPRLRHAHIAVCT